MIYYGYGSMISLFSWMNWRDVFFLDASIFLVSLAIFRFSASLALGPAHPQQPWGHLEEVKNFRKSYEATAAHFASLSAFSLPIFPLWALTYFHSRMPPQLSYIHIVLSRLIQSPLFTSGLPLQVSHPFCFHFPISFLVIPSKTWWLSECIRRQKIFSLWAIWIAEVAACISAFWLFCLWLPSWPRLQSLSVTIQLKFNSL